jgi:hypothetical protein
MNTIKNISPMLWLSALLISLPGCYTVISHARSSDNLIEEITANADTTATIEDNDSCLSSQDEEPFYLYNGYNLNGVYIPSSIWIDYYVAPLPWWYSGGGTGHGGGDNTVSTETKRNYGQRRTATTSTGGGQTDGTSNVSTGAAVNTGSATTTTTTTSTVNSNNTDSNTSQGNTGATQNNNTQRETTTRNTETTNERRDYGERGSARGGKK